MLRGPDPAVLDYPVRRPSTGDVVRALRRLVGDYCGRVSLAGSFPDGFSMIHLDDCERDSDGRLHPTDRAYRVRWPASNTDQVFVALRRGAANTLQTSWQVVLALAETAVPVEIFRRLPTGDAGSAAGAWEQVFLEGTHPM